MDPASTPELMIWGAYWSGLVARELGLQREFFRGDRTAIRTIAECMERCVALMERSYVAGQMHRVRYEQECAVARGEDYGT